MSHKIFELNKMKMGKENAAYITQVKVLFMSIKIYFLHHMNGNILLFTAFCTFVLVILMLRKCRVMKKLQKTALKAGRLPAMLSCGMKPSIFTLQNFFQT